MASAYTWPLFDCIMAAVTALKPDNLRQGNRATATAMRPELDNRARSPRVCGVREITARIRRDPAARGALQGQSPSVSAAIEAPSGRHRTFAGAVVHAYGRGRRRGAKSTGLDHISAPCLGCATRAVMAKLR